VDFPADFSFKTKTKRSEHTWINSQEKKKHGLKQKNRELTEMKMIFNIKIYRQQHTQ
jgi:hypothetical protein